MQASGTAVGYPDYLTKSGAELIDAQYRDRENLRPICDAVIAAASALGDVAIQARKTYVSLVNARRTFARIQATSDRVDVAFRLEKATPKGRLKPSRIHDEMKVQVELSNTTDVDSEVMALLEKAYQENS